MLWLLFWRTLWPESPLKAVLFDKDLRRILPGLPSIAVPGPWYRAVAFEYLTGPPPGAASGSPVQPLWPGGARRQGVRFTPQGTGKQGFECLYLAFDEMTPLLEVTQVLRPPNSLVPLLFEPQVMMTVNGVLTDILDMTDTKTQGALGTSLQELTGDWAVQQADYLIGKAPMPPTQALGQAAFDVGVIAGLKYKSSKNPARGLAIVVFTDRLAVGSCYLELVNKPNGSLRQRLP
jgi:RES domain